MTDNNSYLIKSQALSNRFFNEQKKKAEENPKEFVKWVVSKKEKWSPATWRIYKGASIYFLKQIISKKNEKDNQKNLENAIRKLELEFSNTGDFVCKKKVRASRSVNASENNRTSNNKFKSVPLKEKILVFKELDKVLKNNPTSVANLAKLWLKAGIITGVRPSEWDESKIQGDMLNNFPLSSDDILRLTVKNAKHSKSKDKKRSHSAQRTLICAPAGHGVPVVHQ